jgi:hypothetical protein
MAQAQPQRPMPQRPMAQAQQQPQRPMPQPKSRRAETMLAARVPQPPQPAKRPSSETDRLYAGSNQPSTGTQVVASPLRRIFAIPTWILAAVIVILAIGGFALASGAAESDPLSRDRAATAKPTPIAAEPAATTTSPTFVVGAR